MLGLLTLFVSMGYLLDRQTYELFKKYTQNSLFLLCHVDCIRLILFEPISVVGGLGKARKEVGSHVRSHFKACKSQPDARFSIEQLTKSTAKLKEKKLEGLECFQSLGKASRISDLGLLCTT